MCSVSTGCQCNSGWWLQMEKKSDCRAVPRCFKCGEVITEAPANDPARHSNRWFYTPAFVVEVIGGGCAGGGPCRCAVICWACMHEIDPDMWMSDEGWDAGLPAVPFTQLPALDHDAKNCWDVEAYNTVEVPLKGCG